ncbi:hypothetical protein N9Z64_01935 [bacterium]|nr:hypothetical protein [bacterium]
MSFNESLTVLLALLFYQPLKLFMLGHNKTHPESHSWPDLFGEKEKARQERLTNIYGNAWVPSVAAFLLTSLTYRTLCWHNIDPTHQLRVIISIGSVILTWKAATLDIDLAKGDAMTIERLIVIGSGIGVIFFPGFLFPLIFGTTHFFRGWTHHQHLVIRSSIMFLAGTIAFFIVSTMTDEFAFTASGLFLILVLISSHYIVPGVSKLRLGPNWLSWVSRNQLHTLVGTAYAWGWGRFIPEPLVLRFAHRLQKFNLLFQAATLGLELSAGLLLFDQTFASVLLFSLAMFHLGVFLLSGIMFWQNFVFLLGVAGCFVAQHPASNDALFGLMNGGVGCCMALLLPLGLTVWRPHKLAWWDTPFIDRVDWLVEGVGGKIYGLHNDFMAPNDRLFGNRCGYFLTKGKRITQHLGETKRLEVANALYSNAQGASGIPEIIEQFGVVASDEILEQKHDRYMIAFLTNYNRGKRKSVCPRWVRAPGDQYYYWGRNERFHGQDKVRRLIVRHRQELVTEHKILTITNELVKTLEIPLE